MKEESSTVENFSNLCKIYSSGFDSKESI